MELKLVENHLTCKCESCGKDNEKAIEFKFDYNGKVMNLCNDCRDKLIIFLQENRETKKADALNVEFWVRFLCNFNLAKIIEGEDGKIKITLPIREDEQARYKEIFKKQVEAEKNEI